MRLMSQSHKMSLNTLITHLIYIREINDILNTHPVTTFLNYILSKSKFLVFQINLKKTNELFIYTWVRITKLKIL